MLTSKTAGNVRRNMYLAAFRLLLSEKQVASHVATSIAEPFGSEYEKRVESTCRV